MNPAFFQYVQQAFVSEGAKVEAVDDTTFRLKIKRTHPKFDKLIALFQEFQTRAATDGLEVQHLYKPGGHDRINEMMRDILGPELHDRLVADLNAEWSRRAGERAAEGAMRAVENPGLFGAIAKRALEDGVIRAARLPSTAINKVEAMARGEKVDQ